MVKIHLRLFRMEIRQSWSNPRNRLKRLSKISRLHHQLPRCWISPQSCLQTMIRSQPDPPSPMLLVSSWGGSSKSTVKPESSTAKYKQPLKKRRRLSTAVVKSLNSPGKHLYHHLVQLIFFVHISSRQQQQFQVGEVDTEETSSDGIHRRIQSIWWNTKEIRN